MKIRNGYSGLLLVGAIVMAGCGDSRFSELSEGIDRDSVATLMGVATPDHQSSYLVRGVFWEVMYYGSDGAAVDSTTDLRTLAPVVMADGKVAGWGWGFLDETAQSEGLSVPQPAVD